MISSYTGCRTWAQFAEKHWALIAAHSKSGHELVLMQQYLKWFNVMGKTVFVDKLINAPSVRAEIEQLSGTPALPLLFINKKLVGDIDALHALNESAKLKDVLQFGFEWPDLHTASLRKGPLGRVSQARPRAKDEQFFHAIYRGAPKTRTVAQLPRFSPFSTG